MLCQVVHWEHVLLYCVDMHLAHQHVHIQCPNILYIRAACHWLIPHSRCVLQNECRYSTNLDKVAVDFGEEVVHQVLRAASKNLGCVPDMNQQTGRFCVGKGIMTWASHYNHTPSGEPSTFPPPSQVGLRRSYWYVCGRYGPLCFRASPCRDGRWSCSGR